MRPASFNAASARDLVSRIISNASNSLFDSLTVLLLTAPLIRHKHSPTTSALPGSKAARTIQFHGIGPFRYLESDMVRFGELNFSIDWRRCLSHTRWVVLIASNNVSPTIVYNI